MKNKKAPIIAGVAVAVVVLAGAGMMVWHESPSFCGAICHTPMDGYVSTLTATEGESATDKYGNEVSDASAMLATVHASCDEGYGCLDCHVPTLSEQIGEATSWLSGDYEVVETSAGTYVPEETTLEDLTEASGTYSLSFCLNESCHDLTCDDLTELTSDLSRNPHEWQHGVMSCDTCHKSHRASVLYCTKCHSDCELPSGWVTWSESEQILEDLS